MVDLRFIKLIKGEIMSNITKGQFASYKAVQESGAYNMFDPRAKSASGLDDKTYIEIIKNYDELEAKYGNE